MAGHLGAGRRTHTGALVQSHCENGRGWVLYPYGTFGSDGGIYDGKWEDHKQHGRGVYT